MTPVAVDVTRRPVPLEPAGAGNPHLSLLRVVSDPVRWRILTLLAEEQLCTTHLQDLLGAKQTLVSHHLKVLREAGLLDTEPCGRFTYYRLRPGALDGLSSSFGALAAASHREPRRRAC